MMSAQKASRDSKEPDAVADNPAGAGEQNDAAFVAQDKSAQNETALEHDLKAAQAEAEELRDRALRLQAELENFRKRVQKEAAQERKYHASALVRDLLPGLDNLHRAVEAAHQTSNVDELIQGVRMVCGQFEETLKHHSVVPIEAVGHPFDPNRHEAIQQVPSEEHPPMTVVQELQRGYLLHDRVVRPSQVIVSSGPPATDATQDASTGD